MAHLSFDERIVISQLLHSGATRAEIARQLGRHPSTNTRELQRNRSDLHSYQLIKRIGWLGYAAVRSVSKPVSWNWLPTSNSLPKAVRELVTTADQRLAKAARK